MIYCTLTLKILERSPRNVSLSLNYKGQADVYRGEVVGVGRGYIGDGD